MSSAAPEPQPFGHRPPPPRVPPTAVGTQTPEPPRPPRVYRDRSSWYDRQPRVIRGALNVVRVVEVAIFGRQRRVGPAQGWWNQIRE